MLVGLAGLQTAWQMFVDTINLHLPAHWWVLQSFIDTLAGGSAAAGAAPTSGNAPTVAIPLPTAAQILIGIGGQLLTWPSVGPPPIYYGGGGGGVINPGGGGGYQPPPVLQ